MNGGLTQHLFVNSHYHVAKSTQEDEVLGWRYSNISVKSTQL